MSRRWWRLVGALYGAGFGLLGGGLTGMALDPNPAPSTVQLVAAGAGVAGVAIGLVVTW